MYSQIDFEGVLARLELLTKSTRQHNQSMRKLRTLIMDDHWQARLMDSREICGEFHISRQTLYRWRRGQGLDCPFPQPARQRPGRGGRTSNLWLRVEVEEWFHQVRGVRVKVDRKPNLWRLFRFLCPLRIAVRHKRFTDRIRRELGLFN